MKLHIFKEANKTAAATIIIIIIMIMTVMIKIRIVVIKIMNSATKKIRPKLSAGKM